MNETLMYIKTMEEKNYRIVWISPWFPVHLLIEQMHKTQNMHFDPCIYWVEQKMILDPSRTLEENKVVSGDHLIVL